MKKEFVIIRGTPGAGKSTLAKSLIAPNTVWCEADHYFYNFITGEYNFDLSRIADAHAYCRNTIENAMKDDYTKKVIVSNTFTTRKELVPYFEMAKECHIKPLVITLESLYKNVHNVPEMTLEAMKKRFDYRAASVLFDEYFGDIHAQT